MASKDRKPRKDGSRPPSPRPEAGTAPAGGESGEAPKPPIPSPPPRPKR
jgi:hypothetical protein